MALFTSRLACRLWVNSKAVGFLLGEAWQGDAGKKGITVPETNSESSKNAGFQ